jgi:gliding motility-associated protein GldL
MLIVGLGTEAAIFAISAFEPLPHEEVHYDWTRVYPQLKEDDDFDEGELEEQLVSGSAFGTAHVAGQSLTMDPKAIEAANKALTPELFEGLSNSIKGLKEGVENLSEVTDVGVATNEFGSKVKQAATKVDQLTAGYSTTAEVMKQFSSSMSQVKTYQEQISTEVKNYQQTLQSVTKNLSSLNNVYELELQDAQKHINSINKFYGSISNVMQNLLDASKDTDNLRKEVSSLAVNMNALNAIYGNMLTAMASGASGKK